MTKVILNPETETGRGQYETICSECNTHFTFNKIDTYEHTNQDIDGPSTTTYVDCPHCKHSIAAGGIMNPNRNNGGFGFFAKSTIPQKVFANVNVPAFKVPWTSWFNETKQSAFHSVPKDPPSVSQITPHPPCLKLNMRLIFMFVEASKRIPQWRVNLARSFSGS